MNDMKPISNCSVAIIVPIEGLDIAKQIAQQIGTISDKDTFSDFFSVPLSTSGEFPATHYGCHTHCRPSVIERLPAVSVMVNGAVYEVTRFMKVETGKSFDDLVIKSDLKRIEVQI